jgi:hypothetical protein
MYIDWIPTRPGPVKRLHTICAALANNPVENFWNCVSIWTERSLWTQPPGSVGQLGKPRASGFGRGGCGQGKIERSNA